MCYDNKKKYNRRYEIKVIIIYYLLFLLSPLSLIADSTSIYFLNKEYDKALPILKKEAKNGSKQAMYKLGFMYEKGLGTKVDHKKSLYWYKQMSKAYSYSIKMPNNDDVNITDSFLTQVEQQIDSASDKKGTAFAISKIDTDTPETKRLMSPRWENDFFGLIPFHEHYLLPLSVANSKYPRRSESVHPHSTLTPIENKYKEYKETEVEFQISFQKQLSYNFFGWNEFLYVAYTQTVWWQLYEKSSPFREMNYQPEIFIAVPTSKTLDEEFGLKAIRYGYLHESNGQDGYRSRSWNRLHVSGLWQWDNLFLATRIWYRLPENLKSDNYYNGNGFEADGTETDPNEVGDDNPNIEEYMGYGDINLHYLYGKHQIATMLRYNFGVGGKQRGAVEFNWSYPFFHSKNMFWYTKAFNGYGESLIDYNRNVTKVSFGFSFSRALF